MIGQQGDRGPKGDHGQHGDAGARGATGRTAGTGLFIVTILAVAAMIGIGQHVFRQDLAHENRERAKDLAALAERISFASCERGNDLRGYLRIRAMEFVKTDTLDESFTTKISPMALQIVSCDLVARGKDGTLTRAQDEKYLRVWKTGQRPLVKNGQVVGSEPR